MKLIIPLLLLASTIQAEPRLEKDYQELWCRDGVIEYVLSDKTRIDCLTKYYAIEFDFAGSKIYEAIGQSLYYASITDKRPGIVLISRSDKDLKYWDRLQYIVRENRLPIQLWLMKHKDYHIKTLHDLIKNK